MIICHFYIVFLIKNRKTLIKQIKTKYFENFGQLSNCFLSSTADYTTYKIHIIS